MICPMCVLFVRPIAPNTYTEAKRGTRRDTAVSDRRELCSAHFVDRPMHETTFAPVDQSPR